VALLSIPYVFVPNTTAYSAQVDANFTAVATAVNSIDRTNIGVAGIDASSIIPGSSSAARVGGTQTYTFPTSLAVGSNITLTGSSGAVSATTFNATGNINASSLTTTGSVTSGAGLVAGGPISGATTGSFSGGVSAGSFNSAGNVNAVSYSVNSAGYLPPLLTASGAFAGGLANPPIMVSGRGTSNGSGVLTVTLAGMAQFSSGTTYQVFAQTGWLVAGVTAQTSTGFTLTASNGLGPSTIYWFAVGY
jgi:hypothetical protein